MRSPIVVVDDRSKAADDAREILEVLEERKHIRDAALDLDRRLEDDAPPPFSRAAYGLLDERERRPADQCQAGDAECRLGATVARSRGEQGTAQRAESELMETACVQSG